MDSTLYGLLNGKIGKLDSMPTASAESVGIIVQYIGETTSDFTNGYFYKGTQSGSTYSWTRVNVQPGGSGGTSDFDELENRPKYNGTLMTGNTDIPEAKVFVATYGTTTASEVAAALTAGKAVICEYTQDDIHCQMLLETESNSKYTFTEAGVSTYNGTTSVYGYGAALNKTTNVWELASGNGTIPSTAEQITYDSSAASHTSGSVGAAISEQSSQIETLESSLTNKTASASDVGKFAKVKTVNDGKVSEWEYGEASGGAAIDDTATATDKVWSSSKTSAEISAKYSKPSSGIPKTDLVSAVQTSLNKADTAEQASNRVDTVDSSSDKFHYPSAYAVYKAFGDVFNVAVNANNDDFGTVTGGGVYRKDEDATLTATPASGYTFVKWKDAATGASLSTNTTYTFAVTKNRNIIAAFADETAVTKAWNEATDAEITSMIVSAEAGAIDLGDYWLPGQTRTVQLSATEADSSRGIEAHAAQSVELVVLDTICNGFTIGGETAQVIIGLKNGLLETGQMNSSNTNVGGWQNCKRRSWCNAEFRNSLPETVKGWFKQFEWQNSNGGSTTTLNTTSDYFALPPAKCVFGSDSYSHSEESALYTQWEYYKTSSNRVKKEGASGSAGYWWESSPSSGNSYYFCIVNSNGSASYDYASDSLLLAPFGCI